MREHFLRSGMRSQATHEGEESVLRGYDSLREIDHWHLIIVLLILGMTGVVFILSPAFNNLSSLDAESWSLYAGSALILLFVLFLVSLPLWAFIHQRREQKKRDTLRRSAIKAHSSPLAPIQPPPFHTLVLPLRIESRLKRGFIPWITLGGLFLAAALSLNYVLLNDFWGIPSFISEGAPFLVIILSGIGVWIAIAIQDRVTGHYLLPSLQVNDDGITARYGRDTISMRWRDVRYFAVVGSTALSKKSGREAFELSDGENRICWLAAAPFHSYRLSLSNEIALTAQDYASFTRQLASLIVVRTSLPLSDFRLPARQRKRERLPALSTSPMVEE